MPAVEGLVSDEPSLNVTAQQSRFHADAADTSVLEEARNFALAIAGVDGTVSNLTTSEGIIVRHSRAKFDLYSQQAVEELNVVASANPGLTALTHLLELTGSQLSEQVARGLLSGLGLAGRVASDVPIALLSGGQKGRLALAKLLWTPPHLLILDEVTIHLDSDTIQALALAMKRYEGAILVITHDRFFMRCVVEASPQRLWLSGTRMSKKTRKTVTELTARRNKVLFTICPKAS